MQGGGILYPRLTVRQSVFAPRYLQSVCAYKNTHAHTQYLIRNPTLPTNLNNKADYKMKPTDVALIMVYYIAYSKFLFLKLQNSRKFCISSLLTP